MSEKWGIDQNVKIWGQSGESTIMLKCEDKVGNWSKCWNLSKTWGINQNVEIWVQNVKSTFECNKVEIDQNVKIWAKRGDRSNVDILLQKWKSIKLLEFDWKIRNWSEYWNLRTTLRIDQNVEIRVQNVNSIWGKQQ